MNNKIKSNLLLIFKNVIKTNFLLKIKIKITFLFTIKNLVKDDKMNSSITNSKFN